MADPGVVADPCLRCRAPLQTFGVEDFRVVGAGGGWKRIIGELAEIGEDVIPFEILVCPECKRVELRAAFDTD